MNPGSWWREAVVVLPPDVRAQQVVERGDGPPPGHVARRLQPLGVLVEHRVDDVDEGLVAAEEAVASGEQVALEPALALVLAQDLHQPAVRRDVVVLGADQGDEAAVRGGEDVLPAVGVVLVGAEDAEVPGLLVELHDVAQEAALDPRGLGVGRSGARDRDRVVAEVGQPQVPQQQPAVGVRVGAHATRPARRKLGQLRPQPAVRAEELPRPVALHPALQHLHVPGLVHVAHRDLVAAPVVFALEPVDRGRAGPALGRAQHEHRPRRPIAEAVRARHGLDPRDLFESLVEGRSHLLVHRHWLVPLDEVRPVAVALEQLPELVLGDAGQERGAGDLVAVEVQDGEHAAVPHRVQELVGVPAGGERTRLRLAVAHDGGDDEAGVVEGRAVGVRQRVAELAALVDRAGGFGRDVARNAAGEAELLEQPLHPLRVLADLRIHLRVGALEVGLRHHGRTSVPGPDHVDHVEVALADQAVEVHVDEVEAGRRAPVPEQAGLHVLAPQRLVEQGVVEQVDLAHGEVVRGTPVRVDPGQQVGSERTAWLPAGRPLVSAGACRWLSCPGHECSPLPGTSSTLPQRAGPDDSCRCHLRHRASTPRRSTPTRQGNQVGLAAAPWQR